MHITTLLKPQSLISLAIAFLLSLSLLPGCSTPTQTEQAQQTGSQVSASTLDLSSIPAYTGSPSVEVDENEPQFTDDDKSRSGFEDYSELDSLGRCGVAFALIGEETMPTEERGKIGSIKPSGWHTVRYDGLVEDDYLYNRCHLIGFQLAGENANPKNLITGTRYMNVEGMLPYEEEVADYVHRTDNHVLYRVTPVFEGENLVASGVQMEAWSVEDDGAGVSFNVYCYNVQPGISIDYATGESSLAEDDATQSTSEGAAESAGENAGDVADENAGDASETTAADDVEATYVLNTSSKRFHDPSCSSVDSIKEYNKQEFTGSRQKLIDAGYLPCGECNP